jgi:hypothetical protein
VAGVDAGGAQQHGRAEPAGGDDDAVGARTVEAAAAAPAADAGNGAALDEEARGARARPERGAGGDRVVHELGGVHLAPQRQPIRQRAPQSKGCARAGSMNLSCGRHSMPSERPASAMRVEPAPRSSGGSGATCSSAASSAASCLDVDAVALTQPRGGGAEQPAYMVVAPPTMSGRTMFRPSFVKSSARRSA